MKTRLAIAVKSGSWRRWISLGAWLPVLLFAACDPARPGVFTPPDSLLRRVAVATGQGPAHVLVLDADQDGRQDLVTANRGGSTLSVLLATGDWEFGPAPNSPIELAAPPHLLASGDFNEDGRPDLVASSHDSWGLVVLLGRGEGRFTPAPGSPFPYLKGQGQPHNHGLAAGDVDADGHVDLVASDQNANSISLLLGDGEGGFEPAPGSPYPTGRSPYPVTLVDLDGDGKLDVAVPNLEDSSVSLLMARGRRLETAPGSPVPVPDRPFWVAAGDVNTDGRPDLAVLHDDSPAITLLLGSELGFEPASTSPVEAGGNGWKAVLADLDRDGNLDLAASCWVCGVLVLRGDGRAGFNPWQESPFPAGRGISGLTLADLDGDAQMEVVVTAFDDDQVVVLSW